MKLTLANVAVTTATSAFSKNVRSADEMKAFWLKPENAKLIRVGRFLAQQEQGKSLAQHLIEGAEISLAQITVDGFTYPLNAGYTISLKTLSVWGCIACGSAHGSGIGKSAGITDSKRAAGLASNRWYYNPATRDLFVISYTCFDSYVKGLGAAKHIVEPFALQNGGPKKA